MCQAWLESIFKNKLTWFSSFSFKQMLWGWRLSSCPLYRQRKSLIRINNLSKGLQSGCPHCAHCLERGIYLKNKNPLEWPWGRAWGKSRMLPLSQGLLGRCKTLDRWEQRNGLRDPSASHSLDIAGRFLGNSETQETHRKQSWAVSWPNMTNSPQPEATDISADIFRDRWPRDPQSFPRALHHLAPKNLASTPKKYNINCS